MNFEDKVTRMENGIRGGGIEIDLTGFGYPDGEIYEIITEISEKGRITPRAKTYIDKLPRKDELNEYLDKNLSSNSITQLQVAFGQAKEDKLITGDVTRDFNKKYFSRGGSTYAKGGEIEMDLSNIGLKGYFEHNVVDGLAKVYDIYYVSERGGYTLVKQTTENPKEFIIGYVDYLQSIDGIYLLGKLKKEDAYSNGLIKT